MSSARLTVAACCERTRPVPPSNTLAPPTDPRDRVTPDDLNVAPALLGAPLARPGRRLLAITIDVVIVALLSSLGNLWLLGGFALIALVHLREPRAGDTPRRRWLLWALDVALLAVGAQQAWVERGSAHDDEHEARAAASEPKQGVGIDGLPEAIPGLTPLQAAQTRIAVLQAQLLEVRKPKPFDLNERIHAWADDVGLGLGWAIAYFPLLPVWWQGQTVGTRLLGLRVVELTGKPLTALRAFKRYGGYAAGMATGLFGFAQVLWDPNRQAIQDKTAHTVVIDLRRKLADPPGSPPFRRGTMMKPMIALPAAAVVPSSARCANAQPRTPGLQEHSFTMKTRMRMEMGGRWLSADRGAIRPIALPGK